jgi:hypothetical protein
MTFNRLIGRPSLASRADQVSDASSSVQIVRCIPGSGRSGHIGRVGRYQSGTNLHRLLSSSALLQQPAGPSAQMGSRLALLMHFLRFLAFALPLNFFLHFLTAAARWPVLLGGGGAGRVSGVVTVAETG